MRVLLMCLDHCMHRSTDVCSCLPGLFPRVAFLTSPLLLQLHSDCCGRAGANPPPPGVSLRSLLAAEQQWPRRSLLCYKRWEKIKAFCEMFIRVDEWNNSGRRELLKITLQ